MLTMRIRVQTVVEHLMLAGGLLCALLPTVVHGRQNLALNGGFDQGVAESPHIKEWTVYSSKTARMALAQRRDKPEGDLAVKVSAVGVPRQYQGITQHVPVREREQYVLSALVLADPVDRFKNGNCQLVIEWLNEQGVEISRDYTPMWTPPSSMQWKNVKLGKKKAPKGAVAAVIGLHVMEGDRGAVGSFLVDEIEVYED